MADNTEAKAKVPGGAEVVFKDGEPTKITLTVRCLVDEWYNTHFTFGIDNGVASIRAIEPESDALWVDQNTPAREKAYETVAQIPIVDEVERIQD